MRIRRATPGDAQALTSLMHASAAYAGRYAGILEGYGLTLEQIRRDRVFRVEQYGALAGFYSLILRDEPELDLMFVADTAQGTGVGALLIEHLRDEARRLGVSTIKIVSHPPSVGFYQRMGAMIVGLQAPAGKAAWGRPTLSLPVS